MHLTLNPASLLLPETVYVFGGNITYALANVTSEKSLDQ